MKTKTMKTAKVSAAELAMGDCVAQLSRCIYGSGNIKSCTNAILNRLAAWKSDAIPSTPPVYLFPSCGTHEPPYLEQSPALFPALFPALSPALFPALSPALSPVLKGADQTECSLRPTGAGEEADQTLPQSKIPVLLYHTGTDEEADQTLSATFGPPTEITDWDAPLIVHAPLSITLSEHRAVAPTVEQYLSGKFGLEEYTKLELAARDRANMVGAVGELPPCGKYGEKALVCELSVTFDNTQYTIIHPNIDPSDVTEFHSAAGFAYPGDDIQYAELQDLVEKTATEILRHDWVPDIGLGRSESGAAMIAYCFAYVMVTKRAVHCVANTGDVYVFGSDHSRAPMHIYADLSREPPRFAALLSSE